MANAELRDLLAGEGEAVAPTWHTTPETVCQEADRLVSGVKREEYGSPQESLDRLALMWSGILGKTVTGREVALCLVALKIGREAHKPKRDNRVDGCGYFKLLDLYLEPVSRNKGEK